MLSQWRRNKLLRETTQPINVCNSSTETTSTSLNLDLDNTIDITLTFSDLNHTPIDFGQQENNDRLSLLCKIFQSTLQSIGSAPWRPLQPFVDSLQVQVERKLTLRCAKWNKHLGTRLMRRTTWSYTWSKNVEGQVVVGNVCIKVWGCSMQGKCKVSSLL